MAKEGAMVRVRRKRAERIARGEAFPKGFRQTVGLDPLPKIDKKSPKPTSRIVKAHPLTDPSRLRVRPKATKTVTAPTDAKRRTISVSGTRPKVQGRDPFQKPAFAFGPSASKPPTSAKPKVTKVSPPAGAPRPKSTPERAGASTSGRISPVAIGFGTAGAVALGTALVKMGRKEKVKYRGKHKLHAPKPKGEIMPAPKGALGERMVSPVPKDKARGPERQKPRRTRIRIAKPKEVKAETSRGSVAKQATKDPGSIAAEIKRLRTENVKMLSSENQKLKVQKIKGPSDIQSEITRLRAENQKMKGKPSAPKPTTDIQSEISRLRTENQRMKEGTKPPGPRVSKAERIAGAAKPVTVLRKKTGKKAPAATPKAAEAASKAAAKPQAPVATTKDVSPKDLQKTDTITREEGATKPTRVKRLDEVLKSRSRSGAGGTESYRMALGERRAIEASARPKKTSAEVKARRAQVEAHMRKKGVTTLSAQGERTRISASATAKALKAAKKAGRLGLGVAKGLGRGTKAIGPFGFGIGIFEAVRLGRSMEAAKKRRKAGKTPVI